MAQEYCLLEGVPYHLEEGGFLLKGILHFSEDSSIVFRGIGKHCTFSKEECNWMKHASLRTGDTSLLNLIIYYILEQECAIMLKSCYILWTHVSLQGKDLFPFLDPLHLLDKKRDILQGIVEGFRQLFSWYQGAHIFNSIFVFLNCVYLQFRAFAFCLWCICLIAFNSIRTT